MSSHDQGEATDDRSAASVRSLETVTAAVLFALGVVLIADSLRIGAGWTDRGHSPVISRFISVSFSVSPVS